MQKEKSWGISWRPGMYHSMVNECRCDTFLSMDPRKEVLRLVGFTSTDGPQREDMAGIAVFECEKCFELFWFHASEIFVSFAKAHATKWPKE